MGKRRKCSDIERTIDGSASPGTAFRARVSIGSFHHIGRLTVFAQHRMPPLALKTSATGNGPIQNYWVTRIDVTNPRPDGQHHTRAFVPHDKWPLPIQGRVIGVADTRGFNFDQNLVTHRLSDFDRFNCETALAIGYGSSGLHRCDDRWLEESQQYLFEFVWLTERSGLS